LVKEAKVKMRRCKWKKCVHNTNYAMVYLPKNSQKFKLKSLQS